METTTPLLIAFGANLNPLANLTKGLTLLHQRVGLQTISTVYRTTPLGYLAQPDFLNGAVLSQTPLSPGELKYLLRDIENQCGRLRRGDPYGPRTLDLDVAMMGTMIWQDPLLCLPDPNIIQHPFLLHAIAELAPDLCHPQLGQTLAALASVHTHEGMQADPAATNLLRQILFLK